MDRSSDSMEGGQIKVTPFHGDHIAPEEVLKHHTSSFVKKLLSIRTLLMVITLIIVLAMGVGLIVLSSNTQKSIVNDFSRRLQENAEDKIMGYLNDIFSAAEADILLTKQWFLDRPLFSDESPVELHRDALKTYEPVLERMFDIVRKRLQGSHVQMLFTDGRLFGVESYGYKANVYDADLYGKNYVEYGWPIQANSTVAKAVKTSATQVYAFNFSIDQTNYAELFAPDTATRGYLDSCDAPPYWVDLIFFSGLNLVQFRNYVPVCNASKALLGYIDIVVGVNSVSDLLAQITDSLKGKIFIMDKQQQLVASSTQTNIFNISAGYSANRMNINNTEEVWIKQVVAKLDNNFENQTRKVKFNNTVYQLSVASYNQAGKIGGNPWIVVTIFTESQFLGQSRAFTRTGISSAVALAVAGLVIVFFVVWYITSPLFELARDMQRMSQLDLSFKPKNAPKLFEVGKLYKSFNSMYIALKSFKSYVPSSIITNIIQTETEARCKLDSANITIMFQDIASFTTIAESMEPVTLATLMSEYMEVMTDVITHNHGTIDKYIGDCIMTLFGAPDKVPNHPVKAVSAAIECLLALKEKNKEWRAKYGTELKTRFGIHTGDVLVGNMGSIHRMNYTAIGDNVNFASRLEGVNKHFGTCLIVSKSVCASFPPGKFLTRKLAKVRVSGKNTAAPIYEVSLDMIPSTIQVFHLYEQALRSFKRGAWAQAVTHLEQGLALAPDDEPSQRLLVRVKEASSKELPFDWSYVEDLTK